MPTFDTTNSYNNWTVPQGVIAVDVRVVGGSGGRSDGGPGGEVTGRIPVSEGEVLSIIVGESGGTPTPGQSPLGDGGAGTSYADDYTGGGGAPSGIIRNGTELAIGAGGGGGALPATYAGGGGGARGGIGGVGYEGRFGEDAEGSGVGGDGGPTNGATDEAGEAGGTTADTVVEDVTTTTSTDSPRVELTPIIPAPTLDAVDASTPREITLTYTLGDSIPDGDVLVERSTDGGSTWTEAGTITDLAATTWTDTGLLDGERYWYRLTRRALSDTLVVGSQHTDFGTSDETAPQTLDNLSIAGSGDDAVVGLQSSGSASDTAPEFDRTLSTTERRGLVISSSRAISQLSISLFAETSGATTAYITDGGGSVIASTAISGGQADFTDLSLNAGTTYHVVVDAGGSSWTEGFSVSEDAPFTEGVLTVESGVSGPTLSNRYRAIETISVDYSVTPDSAQYVSATHEVSNAEQAAINITQLSNVSVDAEVRTDGGTTLGSDTITSTGNHTIALSETDSSQLETVLDMTATGENPQFELADESILVAQTTTLTAQSGTLSATTILPAPTNLDVVNIDADGGVYEWTANHNYGETRVEYRRTSESEWTTDSTVGHATESATVDDLLNGEQYEGRVVAETEHTETEDQ